MFAAYVCCVLAFLPVQVLSSFTWDSVAKRYIGPAQQAAAQKLVDEKLAKERFAQVCSAVIEEICMTLGLIIQNNSVFTNSRYFETSTKEQQVFEMNFHESVHGEHQLYFEQIFEVS